MCLPSEVHPRSVHTLITATLEIIAVHPAPDSCRGPMKREIDCKMLLRPEIETALTALTRERRGQREICTTL